MKRTLTDIEQRLLDLAKSYDSVEDFQEKNLPKYLIARSKNLLKLAFETTPEIPAIDPEIQAQKERTKELQQLQRQAQASANIAEYFRQQQKD